MGSSSTTTAKDQRLAISGDAGQATAPESQITNPLSLGLQASDRGKVSADITMSGIYYNDLNQVDKLVGSIMSQNNATLITNASLLRDINEQNAEALRSLTSQNQDLLSGITSSLSTAGQSFSNLGSNILDSISTTAGEIKEPLTKYAAYAIAAIVLFALFKLWK